MKYHRRFIFWCALTGLLLAVLLSLSIINNSIMGCTLKSERELQECCAGEAYMPDDIRLYWGDSLLFRNEADGSFCLPLEQENGWQGTLRASIDGEKYRLYAVREQHRQKNAAELMRSGEPLRVCAIKGERWLELPVYLSGLPVLELTTETPAAEEANAEGRFRIWVPGQEPEQARVTFNERGRGSLAFSKRNYSFHLKDKKGEPKNMELLGIRDDDDWRLHSLYMDPTLCREKVAYQLWNELAALDGSPKGCTLEYVNLFMDEAYMGVYALADRLDRKTYDLDGEAVLYKYAWPVEMWVPYAFNTRESLQTLTWDGRVSVAWPTEYREGVWGPLNAYAEQFVWAQGKEAVYDQALSLVEMTNMIDTALFKQTIMGLDNINCNMYYLQRGPGQPMYRIPYDFDLTFGVTKFDVRGIRDYTTDILEDYELDAFTRMAPEATKAQVRDRWNALRQDVFSDDHLESLFRGNMHELQESGALAMEAQRRGTGTEPAEQELEALLQAQKARMAYLDTYMQEYVPPERG